MRIETTILSNLLFNEEFLRKTVPFFQKEFFHDKAESILFSNISDFFTKYSKPINKTALKIEVSNRRDLSETEHQEIQEYIDDELVDTPVNKDWLYEKSEEFCKNKAVYNAIMASVKILDGKDKNLKPEAIPTLLSDALSICFDTQVGHDYIEDANERFAFYHRVEDKLAFDLDYFNRVTRGGMSKKTLNVIIAGTNVGKSIFMCHVAGSTLMAGKNVLYITLEMAEERISERIDAHLMQIEMNDLPLVDKKLFDSKIAKIAAKTKGKLIVKEYPTAGAHAGHFRALLEELKLKKNFIPDLLIIDYLNICSSSRLKKTQDTYGYVKSIAEEVRGLATEYNIPILSATQFNRGGFSNSDPDMDDTGESWGLPQTVDFLAALITNEELAALNQILVKQLKNRYNDVNMFRRFVIGLDKSKMMFYDVEESAQADIMCDDADKQERTEKNAKFNEFKY